MPQFYILFQRTQPWINITILRKIMLCILVDSTDAAEQTAAFVIKTHYFFCPDDVDCQFLRLHGVTSHKIAMRTTSHVTVAVH